MSAVQEMFRRDRVFDFMVPKVVEGLDLSHGTVLYMEDVSVAFDGFSITKNKRGAAGSQLRPVFLCRKSSAPKYPFYRVLIPLRLLNTYKI